MPNNASGAYSFLDVVATLSGPGGSFNLSEKGVANEGVVISNTQDKGTMQEGAGGDVMHTLKATKSGRITISALKTGTLNALLSALYNFQSQSSANWGQNLLTITNPVSGDNITCQEGAFVKDADAAYAAEGNIMVWAFNFGYVDKIFGNGFQSTGLQAGVG